MEKPRNYQPNTSRLKRRHNRIKRRLALGMGKAGDVDRLRQLRKELGYEQTEKVAS